MSKINLCCAKNLFKNSSHGSRIFLGEADGQKKSWSWVWWTKKARFLTFWRLGGRWGGEVTCLSCECDGRRARSVSRTKLSQVVNNQSALSRKSANVMELERAPEWLRVYLSFRYQDSTLTGTRSYKQISRIEIPSTLAMTNQTS